MKKLLAILLALMMIVSLTLVSCTDSSSNTDDENDDFVADFEGDVVNGETTPPETDENGETVKPSNGNNSNNNNNNTNTTTMEKVNDTVYVLYTAKIREEASTKTSVDVLGTAPFGAQLARTEKNSKWSKVSYNKDGTVITGYIANDLITTNVNSVTFVEKKNEDGTPVVTKIKDTLGSNAQNAIVRKMPLANGYPNSFKVLDSDEFSSSSIVAQIPKGTANITVVSVSADGVWAYVKGQGRAYDNGNSAAALSEVEGYTLYSNLEIAGNSPSNNQGEAIG